MRPEFLVPRYLTLLTPPRQLYRQGARARKVPGLGGVGGARREGPMQCEADHAPQGALPQADGGVRLARLGAAVGRRGPGDLSRGGPRPDRDGSRERGLVRPPRHDRPRRTSLCLPAGRRWRVSRSGLPLAAPGRSSRLGSLLPAVVPLVRPGLAGRGAGRFGDLRVARGRVHAGGDLRGHRAPPGANWRRWA